MIDLLQLPEPLRVMDRKLTGGLLVDGEVKDTPALLDELVKCASPYQLATAVESICESEELLSACAAKSVVHPLGFDKLLLLETPFYELKLHVWWPDGAGRGREDIHDHRFSFASVVVAGTLRTEVFQMDDTGAQMVRLTECRDGDSGSYSFDRNGVVGVRHHEVSAIGPGSAYFMQHDVLHRVSTPDEQLVATLFLKLPEVRLRTTVLVDGIVSQRDAYQRQSIGRTATERKLRRFVSVIRN